MKLSERMKSYYENITRTFLPRRTYTIIRLDGKAFHTFTKGFDRPFDDKFIRLMDLTAARLCKELQCVKMGYVQSDEISLILTDFDGIKTQPLLDGNIQKIVSISASMAAAFFNQEFKGEKLAFFDSRVFTISEFNEVKNYLLWRQQDATRNSLSMVAQSLYSHKELQKKKTSELHELIFQKGTNWNDLPAGQKRGRVVYKKAEERGPWEASGAPIFSSEEGQAFLDSVIPKK